MTPVIDSKRTNLKATSFDPNSADDEGFWPDRAEPGAICQHPNLRSILMIACPGCGHVSGMEVGNPKPANSPSWLIIGDVAKPESVTLEPSINCVGCCGWHGYLRNGVYTC